LLLQQVDEDKKNADRLNDLVDKLQQRLKVSKRQVEEAVGCAFTIIIIIIITNIIIIITNIII